MLTADEKKLVRLAICDGAFSEVPQQQGGQRTLTPEILEAVGLMSDEAVRTILRAYKANKLAANQTAAIKLATRQAELTAFTTLLNSTLISE